MARPQYDAFVAQLRDLTDEQWQFPTDCAEWSVRDIAAHVAGAADEGAHLRVLLRHMRRRKRYGRAGLVDGLNDAQLADRAGATTTRVVDDLERLAPKAIAARRRAPGPMRRRTVPGADLAPGSTFAYLFDVIFARDVWMHRIDVARATGCALPAVDTDAVVVAQVVRDLGRFWTAAPLELELTGQGGGSWLLGPAAPVARVSTDAVEYLRLLSGRVAQPALAVDGDESVRGPLLRARVAF